MTNVPSNLDYPALKRANLLELSRRGNRDMPADIAAKRVLVALHEAAHFIVAMRNGVPLYNAGILSTRGRRPAVGCTGFVSVSAAEDRMNEARFHAAGAVHNTLMEASLSITVHNTQSFWGDWLSFYPHFISACVASGDEPESLTALLLRQEAEIERQLTESWHVTRSVAAVLLMYSTASGEFDVFKTRQLLPQVKTWLGIDDAPGTYGDVGIDAGTYKRVMFADEAVLGQYKARKLQAMEDEIRREGSLPFLERAAALDKGANCCT